MRFPQSIPASRIVRVRELSVRPKGLKCWLIDVASTSGGRLVKAFLQRKPRTIDPAAAASIEQPPPRLAANDGQDRQSSTDLCRVK